MNRTTEGKEPLQSTSSLQEIYKNAEETKPVYEGAMTDFLDDIRAKNPGQFESVEFKVAPLKNLERIDAKITKDYGGNAAKVVDIVRGTFISDNPDDLIHIQDALEKQFDVVRVKDRISNPTETGLRNFHNNMRMNNGHIVETQVMPSQLWAVKDKSHVYMEIAQGLKRNGAPDTVIANINETNRILQNGVVRDTGLNAYLDPNMPPELRAQYTVPLKASKEFNTAADITTRNFFQFNKASAGEELTQSTLNAELKAAGEELTSAASLIGKGAGKAGLVVIGSLPFLGSVINTAEAADLDNKLKDAINNGEISRQALVEYDVILAGHVAQGSDPTIVMGELGVQQAFNDWADRYGVDGALKEDLRPSSLALLACDVGKASVDIGEYAIEQAQEGAVSAAHTAYDAADLIYDDLSGNTKRMHETFDTLPVLDMASSDPGLSVTNINGEPISMYPVAHSLAIDKSMIVMMGDMIEARQNGTLPSEGRMNMEDMQASMKRMWEGFEEHFEEAQKDGSIQEVDGFLAKDTKTPTPAPVEINIPANAMAVNDDAIINHPYYNKAAAGMRM